MKKNQSKLKIVATFFIVMIGSVISIFRELFTVGWNISKIESHNYLIFFLGLISFFISFQIIKRMNITKKQDEYYLSILGVHFITMMVLLLFVSIYFALIS